jgi:hypothetical protein
VRGGKKTCAGLKQAYRESLVKAPQEAGNQCSRRRSIGRKKNGDSSEPAQVCARHGPSTSFLSVREKEKEKERERERRSDEALDRTVAFESVPGQIFWFEFWFFKNQKSKNSMYVSACMHACMYVSVHGTHTYACMCMCIGRLDACACALCMHVCICPCTWNACVMSMCMYVGRMYACASALCMHACA